MDLWAAITAPDEGTALVVVDPAHAANEMPPDLWSVPPAPAANSRAHGDTIGDIETFRDTLREQGLPSRPAGEPLPVGDLGLKMYGTDLFGNPVERPRTNILATKFVVPPFSTLDARQGYWLERKRAWRDAGLKVGVGRRDGEFAASNGKAKSTAFAIGTCKQEGWQKPNADSVPGHGGPQAARRRDPRYQSDSKSYNASSGHLNAVYRAKDKGDAPPEDAADCPGTSLFDPVLAEAMYRWFTPAKAACDGGPPWVLDPFGGDVARGGVATALGYRYTGIELRPEQIAANQQIAAGMGVCPEWVCGDSADLDTLLPAGRKYDFTLTCPPYYSLEVYSDDPRDLSAMPTYEAFMAAYAAIFQQTVARLAPNRFLVVVVGEIRDEAKHAYHNFVGDTIAVLRAAGMHYYNEFVLLTAVGTVPLRVSNQFMKRRKCGKAHQQALCFYKGDVDAVRTDFPAEVPGAW